MLISIPKRWEKIFIQVESRYEGEGVIIDLSLFGNKFSAKLDILMRILNLLLCPLDRYDNIIIKVKQSQNKLHFTLPHTSVTCLCLEKN